MIKTPRSLLPDSRTLAAGLVAAFDGGQASTESVKILDRKLPTMMSTFPNEIVECELPDGTRRRVFIKYAANRSHDSFGHRGGVAYEAEVYRSLLQPLANFRPRCLGSHTDSKSAETWLILEYIPRSVRVSDIVKGASRQPIALAEAAAWIAQFHTTHEPDASSATTFLNRYDAAYYRGWASRTFDFSRPLRPRFPWLAQLERRQDRWFAPLLKASPTIIHGEFYAKTLLLQRQRLFIVDWESTAIGAGEIDLAALTEGLHWPATLVRKCERAYVQARWPQRAPTLFQRTLDAARIYLHFRWLGERPDWALKEKSLWRYQDLHIRAKASGLL
jgi:hypothetical protein